MRIYKWLFCVLALTGATSSLAASSDTAPPLSREQLYQLLSPLTPKADREALLKASGLASAAGSGYDSFIIGVLFRHGERHPSQIAPQRLDLARQFLQRCLQQERCPSTALASLAELEFEAGEVHWARVWALAYGWVEHRIAKRLGAEPRRNTYADELLVVATESVPVAQRSEHIASLLRSLRKDLGPQLERMVETALAEQKAVSDQPWIVKHPRAKDRASNNVSGWRLYLMQLAPEGGKATGIALIEALPNPNNGGFLDVAVRALEYSPLDIAGATSNIAIQPMGYVINRPLPNWVDFDAAAAQDAAPEPESPAADTDAE